jgi:hypothetical protein
MRNSITIRAIAMELKAVLLINQKARANCRPLLETKKAVNALSEVCPYCADKAHRLARHAEQYYNDQHASSREKAELYREMLEFVSHIDHAADIHDRKGD